MTNRKRYLLSLLSLLWITGQNSIYAQQCNGCSYRGVSVVTNGNFTTGNVGFSSQYSYNSNLVPEANYYIGKNPNTYHGSFQGKDHTTGTGNFMIVNGAPTPGKKVWCQTIVVLPNTYYDFSTWVCSVHPSNPALLQFEINGVQCGAVFQAPATTFTWQEFFYTWYSGANTSATICIENMSTLSAGNDFGLDDITFSPCLSYNVTNKANAGIDRSGCGNINTAIGGNSVISNITYQWSPATFLSNSAIAQPIVNYTNSSDTVVVLKFVLALDSLGLGCITKDTVNVTIYPQIKPNLGADKRVCNTSVGLSTAITTDSLKWNTGASTSSITVNQNGDYLITAYRWGCSGKDTVNVIIDTVPTFTLPDSLKICTGKDTTITSPFTGLWNTGFTGKTITVNTAGTYYQTVTNGTCTFRDTTILSVLSYPTVNLGADKLICNGTPVTLTSGQTGTWQNSSVGTSYSASSSGTYWQTVSNGSCKTTDTIKVVIKNVLPINLPATANACITNPLVLSFSYNGSPQFTWSTGATTPTITVSTSGKYWVKIADSTCIETDTIDVVIDHQPTLNLPSAVKICQGQTTTLGVSSVSGYTYLWNTGASTSQITTGTAGNYILTIANGSCSVSDTVVVNVVAVPDAVLPANKTICQNDSLILNGSALPGYTNLWSTGSTANSITIKSAGIYSLIVTNDICKDTAFVTLSVDSLPISILTDSITFCENSSGVLTANSTAGVGVSWSTGATTNFITVNTAGIYSVLLTRGVCVIYDSAKVKTDRQPISTLPASIKICEGQVASFGTTFFKAYTYHWNTGAITNNLSTGTAGTYILTLTNGSCSSSDTTEVNLVNVPNAVLPANLAICETDSLVLTGSTLPGYSNLWSTGSTLSSITVKSAGIYSLIVTNDICKDTAFFILSVDSLPVSILTDSITFCQNSSGILTANAKAGIGVSWSTGATSNSITVSTAGIYQVTLVNGVCSIKDSAKVKTDLLPVLNLPASVKICQGQTTVLGVSPVSGYVYQWNNGASTSQITTGTAGNYILTIINGTCSISDTVVVNVVIVPDAVLPGNLTICQTDSVVLIGSTVPGYTNLWSTGSTANSITAKSAGTYSLIVTNDICKDTAFFTLSVDSLPVPILTDSITFCENSSGVLTVNAKTGIGVSWSTGATSNSITVNTPGIYKVTLVNGTCTTKDSAKVKVDLLPVLNLPGSVKICQGQTTQLGVSSISGYAYHWNTGASTSQITTGTEGSYILTITNGSCSVSDTIVVHVVTVPDAVLPANTAICQTDSVILTGSILPGYTNLWSTGSTANSITVKSAGTYSLIVTNDICKDTAFFTLSVDSLPVSILTDSITFCENSSGMLTANAKAGIGVSWSTGATNNSITVTTAGTYKVTLVNGTCLVKDSAKVKTDMLPVLNLPASVKICQGQTTTLGVSSVSGYSYNWNTGAASSQISTGAAGNYILTITNGSCSVSDTVVVQAVTVPDAVLPASTTICQTDSVILTGSFLPGYTNVWSTGSTASSITVKSAGTYSLIVSNDICKDTAFTTISVDALPISALVDSVRFCENSSSILQSTSTPGCSVLWNTGSTSPTITVNTAGVYWVKLSKGQCSLTDSAIVKVDLLPVFTLPDSVKICNGTDTTIGIQTNPLYKINWSTGALSSSIKISQTGNYSVTVTNNTCIVSKGLVLNTITVPVVTLPSVVQVCENDSILLKSTANNTYKHLWSNGSINTSIYVSAPGLYQLTVTNDICKDTSTSLVKQYLLPVSVLPDTVIICDNTSAILTATSSSAASVLWSTGATTNTIPVTQAGIYSVKLINGPCLVNDTARLITHHFPMVDLPEKVKICDGKDTIITLITDLQYSCLWSTGSTDRSIKIKQAGDYSVAVKNGACTARDTVKLIVVAVPVIGLPSNVTICEDQTYTLSGSTNPGYINSWSTGSGAPSISVNTAGVYGLKVTNDICSSTGSSTVQVDSLPVSILLASLNFCADTNVVLKSSANNTFGFIWNTGETASAITVHTPGYYSVKITNGACITVDSIKVVMDSVPVLILPPTAKICQGDSIKLKANVSNGFTYSWSTGSTKNTILAKTAGVYTVTVTNGSCSAIDSTELLVLSVPAPILPQDYQICETDSILLSGMTNPGYQNNWSTGENTANIWVRKAGTYSLTVSNDICFGTAQTKVYADQLPVSALIKDLVFCENSSGQLIASTSPGIGFIWNTGESTPSITVTKAGMYKVTMVNGRCSLPDSAWVTVDSIPKVELPDSILFCEGIDTSAYFGEQNPGWSYLWSNGDTTFNTHFKQTSTRILTVTNGSCAFQDSIVAITIAYPSLTLPEQITICSSDSILLDPNASGNFKYQWNTGATSPSIWVKQKGTYIVKAANLQCGKSASTIVLTDSVPVSLLIDSLKFCEASPLKLKATSTGSHAFNWSTGETSLQITPQKTGWYRVNIINGTCTTEDSAWVQIDTLPTVSLPDKLKICKGDSIFLTPASQHAQQFNWSTGTQTPDIWAQKAGNYILTVKNGLCTAKDTSKVLLVDVPTVVLSDSLTICEMDSVKVIAQSNASYQHQWSNGTTSQSTVLHNAGLYKLTVTNDICVIQDSVLLITNSQPTGNLPDSIRFCEVATEPVLATNSVFTQITWMDGESANNKTIDQAGWNKVTIVNGLCTVKDSTWVTIDKTPVFSIPDSVIICAGTDSSIAYVPLTGEEIMWSNGSSIPKQKITTSGQLILTVSSGTCFDSDTTNSIIIDYPVRQLSPTGRICETDSIYLSESFDPAYTYSWNNGFTGNGFWANQPGVYSVIMQNRICSTTDSIELFVDTLPIYEQPQNFAFCEGDSVVLDLNQHNGYSTVWQLGNGNFITIKTAGNYAYSISNGTCTSYGEVIANMDTHPILSLKDGEICLGDTFVVDIPSEENTLYRWGDGPNTSFRTFVNEGDYYLLASRGTCLSTDSFHLTVNPLPNITIPMPQIACMGDTIRFIVSGYPDYVYQWTNNDHIVLSTGDHLNVTADEEYNMMNQYTLNVSTAKGCTFHGVTAASFFTKPTVDLGPDIKQCADSILITPKGNFTGGIWENGDSLVNRWIRNSGSFEFTAHNDHCTSMDQVDLILLTKPNANLPADTVLCPGQTMVLSVPVAGTWNDGHIGTTMNVATAGNYSVWVDNGTCKSNDEINVSYMALPYYEIPDVVLCEGQHYALPNFPVNYTIDWVSGVVDDGFIQTSGNFELNLSNRCGSYTTQFKVTIEDCRRTLFFPSAFSPDQDGTNEVFIVESTGYLDIDLMVFDRWGEMIYREKSRRPAWDGTFRGKYVKSDLYEVRIIAEYKLTPTGALLTQEEFGKVTVLR